MRIGFIGLGRLGANMVRRLVHDEHHIVIYNRTPERTTELAHEADLATASFSIAELVAALEAPRAVWVMVPAGDATEAQIDELAEHLEPGDTIIDGGNSNHQDDVARAQKLAGAGIHAIDMGTSGGVWGLERGYCLTIGGEKSVVERLDPIFASLAPGRGDVLRTPGREKIGGTAERGYLHCGPNGAGHFVKMVHNGIEYGLMAAYAEGLNILKSAGLGKSGAGQEQDAEIAALRNPEHYQFDFDVADITEVWRRGSVITSWLLDLTARALVSDPALEAFGGRVSDSGEGRWTVAAANDLGVPAHVLTAALFERFGSRDLDLFQNKVLSAMRFGFGGHLEKK
jgi:6-phosphogluconate dehydrogenase